MILMGCVINVLAQKSVSWKSLEGQVLKLKTFGLYKMGSMVNPIQTSNTNIANERIFFQNGAFSWLGSLDGDRYYTYTINGDYIYLYYNDGGLHDWFKIITNDDYTITTVSSQNTCRIYTLSRVVPINNNKLYNESSTLERWQSFNLGDITFLDEAPQTEGARIFHSNISNPVAYIQENARQVLHTLYYGPTDSNIPKRTKIYYHLVNKDGISWESNSGELAEVFYSTNWIEKNSKNKSNTLIEYETRGVLHHELTHAYQLCPKGCGNYNDQGEYWCFIEGLADAVRVACGTFEQDFKSNDRPRAESWREGYRVTGYFLYWLQQNKDKNFIRKFNASASELNPWSWDKAMKYILGNKPENGVDELWDKYLHAIGDRR